jgi:Flp pilus assembly protein TadD
MIHDVENDYWSGHLVAEGDGEPLYFEGLSAGKPLRNGMMNENCFGGRGGLRLPCRWLGAVLLMGALGASGGRMAGQIPSAPQPQGAVAQKPLEDARKLMDAGDFKQAATLLKAYLQTETRSAAAHEMLAYSYLRLDDPKDSLQEYTSAAAIEHPRAVDLQNVAKDYVLLGDMTDAEHWAKAAVQMDERDPDGWYELGRIRFTQQRFQEAVDGFERSLVLLPRSVKAENNLGLSYEGLNRTDDAVAAYRQAIAWQQNEAHPSEQPLLNLSIILVHQEKLAEAKELLVQAAGIAPGDPRIREQLGHLYLQLNQLPQAEEELQAAIGLDPKKSALHFLLGKVYHEEGQEAKAKAEFALSASLSGYHASPDTK